MAAGPRLWPIAAALTSSERMKCLLTGRLRDVLMTWKQTHQHFRTPPPPPTALIEGDVGGQVGEGGEDGEDGGIR